MKSRSEAKRERSARKSLKDAYDPKPPKAEREFTIDVPSDPINEQVIIAAQLVDSVVRKKLSKYPPDAFRVEQHQYIQAGLIEMVRKGLEYDPAVLARLAPEVDIRILETLSMARPEIPPNLEYHEQMLQWDWHRAQFVQGPFGSMVEAIQNQKETPERLRALARQIGTAFEDSARSAPFLRDSKEVVHEMMKRVRDRSEGVAFHPFGISDLDYWEQGSTDSEGIDISGLPRILPGAAPGNTTILTGLSGAGKTTLAAHAILGQARQRRKVAVGAWEVRAPMTLELITVLSLGWSRSRLLDGRSNTRQGEDGRYEKLSPEEIVAFEERAHLIAPYLVFIENPFRRGSVRKSGRVTNDDYLDILEEHIEATGCDVALFDLFDRVLRDRKPDDEQEALWRMLEISERLQYHQILVHQQNMKGDNVRKDMRPSIQGLKGSTAYVDVGSLIIAPHMPALHKAVPNNTIEIHILKQRYAPPFAIECDWVPDTGQLSGGRAIPIDAKDGSGEEEAWDLGGKKKRRSS